MKKFLLLFSITSITLGQGKDIYLYGKVTSDSKEVDVMSGSIWIDYDTSKSSYFTIEDINEKGFYERKLEDVYRIEATTNYHDYYTEKIIVEVDKSDTIRIDFKLIPKPYIFTAKQADKDISNKKLQLITFDTLEYSWTKKINLRKDFGFKYLLLPKPKDDDFEDNIEEYNAVVEKYLESKKHDWRQLLNRVRDSVINSQADKYGMKRQIEIEKLKFPEINRLPKGMRRQLNIFQENYKYRYKDKMKDYTFDYTIDIIKGQKDYERFNLLPLRISIDYKIFLPELIKLLTDDTEVGMTGYYGIMFCRGIAPNEPLGCIAVPFSRDDLFTVAGRANYLLKLISNEDFGEVLPNPDKGYLRKLQNRWAYWAMKLQ